MITTNDEDLYKKLVKLRTHGITKNPEELIENQGGWYYEMQELGYNYRLSDIQAALGNSQLKRAEEGLRRRKDIAQKYYNAFKNSPYIKGQSGVVQGHAYHLYVIEVDDRKGLYDFLRDNNVFAQVHYIPVHLMPYYKKNVWKNGDCSMAEEYYKRCLSLPMYPSLGIDEQDYVISLIKNYYE